MSFSIYPPGTTLYHPEKCYNSYILYEGQDGRSFLIERIDLTVAPY